MDEKIKANLMTVYNLPREDWQKKLSFSDLKDLEAEGYLIRPDFDRFELSGYGLDTARKIKYEIHN